jgi:hypothetical protein
MSEFSKYPFCDTDVWVFLVHCDIITDFLNFYEKILFSDTVEQEIMRWQKNNTEFKNIADSFVSYKASGDIIIVDHRTHFTAEELISIKQTLKDLDFSFDILQGEKDKGEFVTALYAQHFGAPFLCSNDSTFKTGGRGKSIFFELIVKDHEAILNEFVTEYETRSQMRTTYKQLSADMRKDFKDTKLKNSLQFLQEKMNSRRIK